MVQAQALVAEKGIKANNWFIHTPVCCPSRAELLSGRYFHNVRQPSPKNGCTSCCMHIDVDKVNPASFVTHLSRYGNFTAGWFGKHMNKCPTAPPSGFDCPTCYWFTNGGGRDVEPGGYLNATFNDYAGGKAVSGTPYHQTAGTYTANTNGEYAGYTTSIIANKSIEWVRNVAVKAQPFFVAVASKGPHVPATPAPWYANRFSDLSAPRTPDYNASAEQLSGHHALIAKQDVITEAQGRTIDELFRNRWRTLLSIDDAIAGMVHTLEDTGVLNHTYIIITSDHGYNLGQHRLPSCKLNVYDHDVRIPMVIRGPGIKAGGVFDRAGSNVDVGPTILSLAGIDGYAMSPVMDGRSVAGQLVDRESSEVRPATLRGLQQEKAVAVDWRQHHFIEYYSLGNVTRTFHLVDDTESNTYRALRFLSGGPVGSGNMLYAEFTAVKDWNFTAYSFVEIFDMDADPHQLVNLASNTSASVKAQLHEMLQKQWECSGLGCESGTVKRFVTV